MSILGSMRSGVAGLASQSNAFSAISDNISNLYPHIQLCSITSPLFIALSNALTFFSCLPILPNIPFFVLYQTIIMNCYNLKSNVFATIIYSFPSKFQEK